jgi:hypothetical protein
MTVDDFRKSLAGPEPPAGLTQARAGLWWDGKGDWTRAHESAQQDEGPDGSWVHAYLHRKEGDQGNTAYWCSRAGEPVCREPLDSEWLSIRGRLVGIDQMYSCARYLTAVPTAASATLSSSKKSESIRFTT